MPAPRITNENEVLCGEHSALGGTGWTRIPAMALTEVPIGAFFIARIWKCAQEE